MATQEELENDLHDAEVELNNTLNDLTNAKNELGGTMDSINVANRDLEELQKEIDEKVLRTDTITAVVTGAQEKQEEMNAEVAKIKKTIESLTEERDALQKQIEGKNSPRFLTS